MDGGELKTEGNSKSLRGELKIKRPFFFRSVVTFRQPRVQHLVYSHTTMGQCLAFIQTLVSGGSVVSSSSSSSGSAAASRRLVLLSTNQKGDGVKCSNWVMRGEGVLLASSSCEQDYCYFEVKVLELGDFFVGVCRQSAEPVKEFAKGHLGTSGNPGWGLASSRVDNLQSGDVIGVYVDQSSIPKLKTRIFEARFSPLVL